MEILLCIVAIVLNIVGLIGCFIPMLPGPPISFIGVLMIYLGCGSDLGGSIIAACGFVTLLTVVLDYIIPMLGVRYFGGTRYGKWGGLMGTIVGMFFLPWGILVGPFMGAFVGELVGNSTHKAAFRSGIGSLVGFLFGVLMKFVVCIYFLWLTVSSVWNIIFS